MKTDQILYALLGGSIVGLIWLATQFAGSLSFEAVIGYGAVGAIVALAAIDYRSRAKKLFR